MATTKNVKAATKKSVPATKSAKPTKAAKGASAPKAAAAPRPAAPAKSATPQSAGGNGLASAAWPDGFGETAADELAFRRGFPHVRSLGGEPTADPSAQAKQALGASDPILDFVWPGETARRFLRAFVGEDPAGSGAAQPVADPKDLIERAMSTERHHRSWRIEDFVFLLEAEAGPDRVASAILDVIEEGGKLYASSNDGPEIAFTLGFLIGRSESSAALRDRTIRAREAIAKTKKPIQPDWAEALDIVIDGNRAFDLAGWMLSRYVFVTDSAALAQKLVQAPGQFLPDVRLAYLGGPAVLATFFKRVDELPVGPLGRRFFHQLAPMKRALAKPIMEKLAKRADTKALASAWLG